MNHRWALASKHFIQMLFIVDALFIPLNILCEADILTVPVSSYIFVTWLSSVSEPTGMPPSCK